MCPAEAYLDLRQYELPPVPRSSDPAEQDILLRRWQADAIAKYPALKNAYALLLGCWTEYHPEAVK